MGRSFGRGTGKETNPVIINKEFTMSGTGWCPGLDYEGNPEGCFIGFPEEWMPLSTSNPDLDVNPVKRTVQTGIIQRDEQWHGKRQNLHCEQQFSGQGEAVACLKKKVNSACKFMWL